MSILRHVWVGLILLASVSLWSQDDKAVPVPAVTGSVSTASGTADEDRMQPPPPVSGESYPVAFTSETRANYLRGGIVFNSAYSDNSLPGTAGPPFGEMSYSVWPTLSIDQTLSRLHWVFSYAPGFTFYQRTSTHNEADHNIALDFQYRLSPHVTFSLRDSFQKSSNVFNQPGQGLGGTISGSVQGADNFVIAPIADRITNTGNTGINYQFSANSMVGASGTFTDLHYPNRGQVPGLYDSSTRSGLAFYNHRFSKEHSIGATYQYQKLLSYPAQGKSETQTDALLLFYTFYPTSTFSLSFFGGPQYSSTVQVFAPRARAWTPAAGGSLNWQARRTAFAVAYSRMVTGGGGLIGAARSDTASGSVRQQLTKTLSASMAGSYANRNTVAVLSSVNTNGHSIAASASLERAIGTSVSLQLGYTRLHQTYSAVPGISTNPDTNREWVSVSYQFSRPLGR